MVAHGQETVSDTLNYAPTACVKASQSESLKHANSTASGNGVTRLPSQFDPKLTKREIEVLSWSAEGLKACEIAELLCLSQETVHSHVKSAVIKLQVVNKTSAVARAMRLGLVY